MRVIAGAYRGRILKTVPSNITRPTTDRIREAWASTLENLAPTGFDGAVVLDAFAGSGALGIETLSRGASRVVFCEQSASVLAVLRENVESLGLTEHGTEHGCVKLLHMDTLKPNSLASLCHFGPFNLLILDPPYALVPMRIARLLSCLSLGGGLLPDCIVSYEQAKASRLDDGALTTWLSRIQTPPDTSFILETRKTYGTVALDYLRYSVDVTPPAEHT